MAKAYTLGNGNMMIGVGEQAQVVDIYFPYVGLENHTAHDQVHRIGVFADNSLTWLDDGSWDVTCGPPNETMASNITAINPVKNVELHIEGVVYNERNIYFRKVTVKNLLSTKRTIKLFIHHQFAIYESYRGDTAYYDPERKVLVHYKGRRIFLMNADYEKIGIDDFSIGLHNIEGKEGTFRDAEDGILSQNPIEHGPVDSTAGFTLEIKGHDEYTLYYWLCVSKHISEVHALNTYVLEKTPQYLIDSTKNFWHAWVNKQQYTFHKLDPDIVRVFKQSLLIIRAHTDNHGAIIASGDSDLLKEGRDYYNYMWPRDGAFTSMALINADYTHVTKNFFTFCDKVINERGYLMHKYRPDGSLGASWHPWLRDGEKQLPIQEDETALVIYALWHYYSKSKDLEFIESVYNSLIKKAAEFMVSYIDPECGLPMPSYDLWEERYGTFTFTSSSVYAGLMAASRFSGLLGKAQNELKYRTFAEKVKKAVIEVLFDEKEGYFYKSIAKAHAGYDKDHTLDVSSFYGAMQFGILDIEDPRLEKIVEQIHNKLECKTEIGGIARYEGDYYFRVSHDLPGNPWILTTLWLAQYQIKKAKNDADLDEARKILQWAVDRALTSGVLPEQMNPYTGQPLSATPLVWSHAEFVTTVILYMQKLEELGISKMSTPMTL